MENRYYLAIDIGASSGRHILAWKLSSALLGIAHNLTNPNDLNLK